MKNQTYILTVWCGAESYNEAVRNSVSNYGCKYNFFRFGCKRIDTVRKYLRGYVEQTKLKGMEMIFPYFVRDDGHYAIEIAETGAIAETGPIKHLFEL